MKLEKELNALIGKIHSLRGDFPDIAAQALQDWKLESGVSEEEVLKLAMKSALPKQWYNESGFGRFNVTLYRDDFIVQIYLMRSMPTEIHDHGFIGAFKALAGSNLHTTFSFSEQNPLTDWVQRGKLEIEKSHIMREGEVVKLQEGGIHQVNRLGSNSITILVSKSLDKDNFYYLYPEFKVKNRPHDIRSQEVSRKVMALRLLHELNSPSFREEAQIFLNGLELDELLSVGTRLGGSEFSFGATESGRNFAQDLIRILESRLENFGHQNILARHAKFLAKNQSKAGLLKE